MRKRPGNSNADTDLLVDIINSRSARTPNPARIDNTPISFRTMTSMCSSCSDRRVSILFDRSRTTVTNRRLAVLQSLQTAAEEGDGSTCDSSALTGRR